MHACMCGLFYIRYDLDPHTTSIPSIPFTSPLPVVLPLNPPPPGSSSEFYAAALDFFSFRSQHLEPRRPLLARGKKGVFFVPSNSKVGCSGLGLSSHLSFGGLGVELTCSLGVGGGLKHAERGKFSFESAGLQGPWLIGFGKKTDLHKS